MTESPLEIHTIPLGYEVVFNRPASRNALNLNMVESLLSLTETIRKNEQVRLLLLRGKGGHFCAGGDLGDMLTAAEAYERGQQDAFEAVNRRYGELLLALIALPCFVAVQVEGAAMGGGLGLVAVADEVLAHTDARFAMPEVQLGLPPAQIAPFVAAKIGAAHTRRLALRSTRLDSQTALALGLVNTVYSTEAEREQALEICFTDLKKASPKALRATKTLAHQQSAFADAARMQQQINEAARAFSFAVTRGDGPEGSRAFMEKRAPSWAGLTG